MSAGHRDLLSSNQHTNALWLLGGTLRGPGWLQAPIEVHKNQCLAAPGPFQGGEQRRMRQSQSSKSKTEEVEQAGEGGDRACCTLLHPQCHGPSILHPYHHLKTWRNLNGHPRAELIQATRSWEWGTEFDYQDTSPLEKL